MSIESAVPTEEHGNKVITDALIIKEFNKITLYASFAANAILLTGVAISGNAAVTGIYGIALLANIAIRNRPARFSARMNQDRMGFIDRHWNELRILPALTWPIAQLKRDVQAGTITKPQDYPPFSSDKFPAHIRRDFKFAAIEAGIKTSVIGSVYSLGKRLYSRFQRSGPQA